MEVGMTIGHFRLIRQLGAGGMGEVYLAEDTTLKRLAAVKVMAKEMAGDSAWRRRFLDEARHASALNHASIATIYEAGAEGDTAYIAMEYVEGATLRDRLRKPLPLKEAVQIARQVAQALAVAHRAGIVHHDIKPANIMLRTDGTAKVLDFGLARRQSVAGNQAETLVTAATATGAGGGFSGTAGYAAPEQLQPGETDARTDLFALGAVMYEMLAGKPPFQGKNVYERCNAVLTQLPAPLETERPDSPTALVRIVSRCLEKDRVSRYQCAADLALDLEAASTDTPVSPAARRFPATVVAAALVVGIALSALTLLWRPARKSYWKLPVGVPKPVVQQAANVFFASLAPDGSQVVYEFDSDLYLQAVGGGDPRRLTNDGLPKTSPRFSSDGKRVIYTRSGNLYVLDLPAGLPRLLLQDAERGLWSPDGSKLAFVRKGELMIGDGEGRDPHSLGAMQTYSNMQNCAWSPDGKRLAVILKGGKVSLLTTDGRSRSELPGATGADAVVFTPDGRFLLIGNEHGLWQFSVQGGPLVPFLTGEMVNGLSVSQDGTKLLVETRNIQGHIVVAEPAPELVESKLRQITFGGGFQTDPMLSPDQKQIVYQNFDYANIQREVWIANVDGSNASFVLASAYHPLWSPDGKTLLVNRTGCPPPTACGYTAGELDSLRLDEGVPRRFPTIEGEKSSSSYTADGRNVLFESKRNLWLAPTDGGEAKALTKNSNSQYPQASPLGSLVAYLQSPDSSDERWDVHVLDYITGRDSVLVTAEALAEYGKLRPQAPQWAHDGKYLFLSTDAALLRVRAAGGIPERFSFPVSNPFAVTSDYRRIIFDTTKMTSEPRLYDDLR